MQNITLALLLFMLLANKCYSQSFKKISKRIEVSNQQEPRQLSELNHKIRLELYEKGNLDFLNKTNDTIWILESQFMDSGITLGRIWNKKGFVDYSFQNGKLDTKTYKPFTKHICDLIENWDKRTIKAEESAQLSPLDSKYIYGKRVIVNSGAIAIDTISFSELFNWKRDTKQ
ncbi:hypothetical protein SAMN04488128_104162 [Chitinophaga eiseniae]|uniref:Uncharacterized protein n=1 Tax=Chitinophaga eiseniae TaxID=634771 RepID=A0A1T4T8I9_9BACT|nr:hypothetical protein [Chitinophaga eiseniae]SKA36737.1 hypothetical protein SAMN04488128_104162 [Chitinophaga eiseniae]